MRPFNLHIKMWLSVLLLVGSSTIGCSTTSEQTDLEKVFKRIPDGEYRSLLEKYTQNDKKYDGFYNAYEVGATLMNTQVQEALLQREGFYMQWDANQARLQREKVVQNMSNSTEVFISMFTPKSEHNDLNKGISMWKVYLEANGLRYLAKIKKFDKNMAQTQNLFPYHTRFSKGYVATFEIPMSSIEKQKLVVILTSSLGTSTLEYQP